MNPNVGGKEILIEIKKNLLYRLLPTKKLNMKKVLIVCFFQPIVLVKNFSNGYEWQWSKEKFLDRKVLMSDLYTDMRDNGDIEKFKVNA